MTAPDFASLFTPSGGVMFGLGFLTRRAWCWLKNRHLDRVDPAHAPHHDTLKMIVLAWGIVLTGIVYIGVQTQVAHDTTVQQAQDARVLATRVAWDQYYSGQERCALTAWLTVVVNPPQSIFDLHTTDPAYQDWARGVNRDYLMQMQAIGVLRQQSVNMHTPPPIPEPRCKR